LSIGDARILAFPVRSARGAFAYVTCPLVLYRYFRETGQAMEIPAVQEMHGMAGETITLSRNGQTGIVLEEYRFTRDGDFPLAIETALLATLNDEVWQADKGRFALLSDGDFGHFVRNACEVGQHVGIDPEKGTARPGALFNTEAVPSEALFCAPIAALSRSAGEDGE